MYDSGTFGAWQRVPSVTVLTSALESLGEEVLFPREVGKYVELAWGQDINTERKQEEYE